MEHIFKQLGHKCKRVRSSTAASSQRLSDSAPDGPRAQSDIEDMIWEVDDDCDRKVTWPEFQSMFARCRNDKTGASLLRRLEEAAPSDQRPRLRAAPTVQRGRVPHERQGRQRKREVRWRKAGGRPRST